MAFCNDDSLLRRIFLFSQYSSQDHTYRNSIRDLVRGRHCSYRGYRLGGVQTVIGFPGHFRDGYDYSRSGNNQSVFKGCFALKKYDRLTSKSTYKGRERRQINICFLKYFKYFCGAEIASYISYLLNDGI